MRRDKPVLDEAVSIPVMESIPFVHTKTLRSPHPNQPWRKRCSAGVQTT